MPNATPCPPPADLRRYLLGDVPEEPASAIDVHLERCPACLAVLAASKGSDTLLDVLPAAVRRRRPSNPVIDRLVSKLSELSRTQPASRTRPGAAVSVQETEPPGRTFAAVAVPVAEVGANALMPAGLPGPPGMLGDYRILRELGRGGMGVVYEAEDVKLRRSVALKVMSPEVAARPDARQRFLQEARATAQLEHENVVAIFHVGEEGGAPFLAMPLLQGETLEQRLHREPKLPVGEAVRLAREAAEGLGAAHERGLIHRDVKPGNLWLARQTGGKNETRLKILDFGLARSLAGETQLTSPGVFMGTPAYVSPEQARGEEVDGRADLFSLGCVLYRMLTGKRPFSGETALAQLRSLEMDEPTPPQQLDPTIPPPVSQLTMRLLAKRAAERPQSAGAVVKWLRAIEGNLNPSSPYPMAIPVLPPRPAPVDDPTLALPPSRPARRRPRWVYVLAASLLAAVGVAGMTWAVWPKAAPNKAAQLQEKDPDPENDEERPDEKRDRWVILPYRESIEPAGAPLDGNSLVPNPVTKEALDSWTIETENYGAAPVTIAFRNTPFVVGLYRPVGGSNYAWMHFDVHKCDFAPMPIGFNEQLSADEKTWMSVSSQSVSIGAVGDEKAEVRKLVGFFAGVVAASLSPSGRRVAISGGGKVSLWDADTKEQIKTSGWPRDWATVNFLAWSPSGEVIAGGWSGGGALSCISVSTGELVFSFVPKGAISSRVWSPDSRLLAVQGSGNVEVWEIKERGKRQMSQPANDVAPAWSPKEKVLVFARGNTVLIWDVKQDRLVHSLKGHRAVVRAVGITPDGGTIASSSDDGTVRFWNLHTGKHLGTLLFLKTGRFLAISPTGHYTGSPGVEDDFVFQFRVKGKRGLQTLHPDKFAMQYGSMKDPRQVHLLAATAKDKGK